MGQLYAGNLEAYNWATDRLKRAGLIVHVDREFYDPCSMEYVCRITIHEAHNTGGRLITELFSNYDIDLLYITMGAWLNRQAEAYESWK